MATNGLRERKTSPFHGENTGSNPVRVANNASDLRHKRWQAQEACSCRPGNRADTRVIKVDSVYLEIYSPTLKKRPMHTA